MATNREIQFILKMKNAAQAAMRQVAGDFSAIGRNAKQAQDAANAAAAAVKGVGDSGERLRRASGAVDGLSARFAALKLQIASVAGAMTGLIASLLAVGAGLAVIAAVRMSVEKYVQFEQQMAMVGAAASASKEVLEQLSAAALNVGNTTEYSAFQGGQGLEFFVRAGMSAKDAIEALPAALNMATADAMELGDVTDILSQVMGQYGLKAKDAAHLTDTLATVSASTLSGIGDLGWALSYTGTAAEMLGVKVNTTVAALGVLADKGLRGTIAGTGLRSMLLDLSGIAEGTAQDKQLDVIANLRLRPADLDVAKRGLIAVLETLKGVTLTAGELNILFGERGVVPVSNLLQGIDKMKELEAATATANGRAAEMAAIIRDTLGVDWQKFVNALIGIGISLVSVIAPALRTAVQFLTTFIHALGGAVAEGDKFGRSATILANAVKVLGVALLALASITVLGWITPLIGAVVAFGLRMAAVTVVAFAFEGAMGVASLAVYGLGAAFRFLLGPITLAVSALLLVYGLLDTYSEGLDTVGISATGGADAVNLLTTALGGLDTQTETGIARAREITTAYYEAAVAAEAVGRIKLLEGNAKAKEDYDNAGIFDFGAAQRYLDTVNANSTSYYTLQGAVKAVRAELARYGLEVTATGAVVTDRVVTQEAELKALAKTWAAAYMAMGEGQAKSFGDAQKGAEMLAIAREQLAIAQATATYGKESAKVSLLTLDAERRKLGESLKGLDVAESVKAALYAALEAGVQFNNTRLSAGLESALDYAYQLTAAIADAIAAAGQALAVTRGALAAIRSSDLGGAVGEVATGMFGGVRAAAKGLFGGLMKDVNARGGVGATLSDAARSAYKTAEEIQKEREKKASKKSGGSSGGADADTDPLKTIREELAAIQGVTAAMRAYGLSRADATALIDATSEARELGMTAGAVETLTQKWIVLNDAKKAALVSGATLGGQMREQLKTFIENVTDATSVASGIVGQLGNVTGNFLNKMLDEGKTFMQSLQETASETLMSIGKMLMEYAIKVLIFKNLLGMKQGAVGGIFDSFLPSAKGNAFAASGAVTEFAKGGSFTNQIVDRPTGFKFAKGGGFANGVMGEAGPEAILPLSRGKNGKLGVAVSGAGMGGGDTIQIVTNIQLPAQQSGDQRGGGGMASKGMQKALAAEVQGVVVDTVTRMMRPGGLLAKAR